MSMKLEKRIKEIIIAVKANPGRTATWHSKFSPHWFSVNRCLICDFSIAERRALIYKRVRGSTHYWYPVTQLQGG